MKKNTKIATENTIERNQYNTVYLCTVNQYFGDQSGETLREPDPPLGHRLHVRRINSIFLPQILTTAETPKNLDFSDNYFTNNVRNSIVVENEFIRFPRGSFEKFFKNKITIGHFKNPFYTVPSRFTTECEQTRNGAFLLLFAVLQRTKNTHRCKVNRLEIENEKHEEKKDKKMARTE